MALTGKKTFAAGRFFGINNVSNPTPMRAVLPQDMSIDFKRSTKELFGEKMFAAATAAGEMSVTGKVTMGTTNARMFTDMIFQDPGATGISTVQNREAVTVPAGTPWQITVANGATGKLDLGVIDAITGTPLTRVASAPATGQYSVVPGTGVYTFATADAGKNVLLSYVYTTPVVGESVVLTNQDMGPATSFTAVMAFMYGAEQDVLTLNNAIATDAAIATKMGDFAKPTLGFVCATDVNDTLGTFSFAQAA
jgi:hypothetical protein